nr:hypothetical protein [Tanacetum cinerariifolium]
GWHLRLLEFSTRNLLRIMEQSNDNGALQAPIGSGFTATSTASEVIQGISLAGKVAIVTGGYTGIGLETTKTLAAAGVTVIVPARTLDKAWHNLAGVANVELAELDLMNPASIDAFAATFLASGRPLHLLFGPFDFEDPNFEHQDYDTMAAYGHSKTALNLFALELDNRAKAVGVRAYSLHPGNIWGTELLRETPMEILQQFGFYDAEGNEIVEVT